jgi:hypothetical protein
MLLQRVEAEMPSSSYRPHARLAGKFKICQGEDKAFLEFVRRNRRSLSAQGSEKLSGGYRLSGGWKNKKGDTNGVVTGTLRV